MVTTVLHRVSRVLVGCGCALCMGCLSSGIDVSDIKHTFGPAGRVAQHHAAKSDPEQPLEGFEDFDHARTLHEQEKYTDAEKAFKKIIKKYKDKPIMEDAMFLLAEAQYQQKHYPAALDSYEQLLKKFETTRYLEKSTQRMWSIANTWLNTPKPASQIELVQYSKGELDKQTLQYNAPPATGGPFFVPNFTDRTRPVFDTEGRALKALNSIWLRDPTGPLADDALMLSATYHLRRNEFQDADHFFNLLREQYPQSEHTPSAYVLGSYVKLMSYQGAGYDARQLEDARRLTESTLRLYPDSPHQEKLVDELKRIHVRTAERDWEKAELYMRKRKPQSAAVYCKLILEKYPDSSYADLARGLLAQIDPQGLADIEALLRERSLAQETSSQPARDGADFTEDPPPSVPPARRGGGYAN